MIGRLHVNTSTRVYPMRFVASCLPPGLLVKIKPIAVTNRIMAARIDRQNMFFGSRAAFCSRTYVDLSLATSLGFQLLIATLWRGGALFLAGDPQQTVSAFPVYGVQNMIASPGGLLGLFEAMERRPEYQCGFEAVFSGRQHPDPFIVRTSPREDLQQSDEVLRINRGDDGCIDAGTLCSGFIGRSRLRLAWHQCANCR